MGLDPVRALVTALRLGGDAALLREALVPAKSAGRADAEPFWRREAPSLRAETTRSRRSTDKADGRAAPSERRSAKQIHTELTTRPASTRSGAALARTKGVESDTGWRRTRLIVWMRDVLGTSDDLKGLGQNARIERWVVTAVGAGGGRAQALTDEHVG
jgi:hypothetical protein